MQRQGSGGAAPFKNTAADGYLRSAAAVSMLAKGTAKKRLPLGCRAKSKTEPDGSGLARYAYPALQGILFCLT